MNFCNLIKPYLTLPYLTNFTYPSLTLLAAPMPYLSFTPIPNLDLKKISFVK